MISSCIFSAFPGILQKMSFHSCLVKPVYVVLFLLAATASTFAQSGRVTATPTPTPVDETLRVVTEEIKLSVLAFDEDGKFFRDVTDRDLVINENNILHQPTSVRRLPANVLIVLDTGGEFRSVKTIKRTRDVAEGVVAALRSGVCR